MRKIAFWLRDLCLLGGLSVCLLLICPVNESKFQPSLPRKSSCHVPWIHYTKMQPPYSQSITELTLESSKLIPSNESSLTQSELFQPEPEGRRRRRHRRAAEPVAVRDEKPAPSYHVRTGIRDAGEYQSQLGLKCFLIPLCFDPHSVFIKPALPQATQLRLL